MEASAEINAKRKNRGLKPRPVRAVVIGFPNVGKSALINRLLNRRVCESAPKPGVTRSLKWLRLGGDLDLLDAPGGSFWLPFLCLKRQPRTLWAPLPCSHAYVENP